MRRDLTRIINQLESVTNELEKSANEDKEISLREACKRARVSESWIYKLADNWEILEIPNSVIERFEYARCLVFDVIIQRLDAIAEGRVSYSNVQGCQDNENTATPEDNQTKIARDKLVLEKEKFKLTKLMPKNFGDKHETIVNNNTVNDNRQLALVGSLTLEQQKQLAKLPLMKASKLND
jgi:hypothetical protein